MIRQFGRQVRVVAGPKGQDGVEIQGVRIGFDVKHTLSGEPSEASIEIYNLSDETTSIIESDDLEVRVFAGYANPGLIFAGNPVDGGVEDQFNGTDRKLKIEAQDGGREIARTQLNVSLDGEVTVRRAFNEVAERLGVPTGTIRIPDNVRVFQGLTLADHGRAVLDRLATMAGADWSIQNGALQVLPKDGDRQIEAASFSAENGNLIDVKRKKKGVKVKAFLVANVRPGDRFRLESDDESGTYKARDVRFQGDSGHANDFFIETTGREVE